MLSNRINIRYNYSPVKISFTSNKEHEAMLRALQKAQAQNLSKIMNYEIHDKGCHNMAQFILNFACAIENNSEHNLDEFFKSEVEAAQLRSKLSPECQKNSLEIRHEIQSQRVFKDPALTLVTANNMKDFVPVDEEFAANKQYQSTINAAKKALVDAVEASDKSKFDSKEIRLIQELTQIIKKTKGLDFGKEYDEKLQKLLQSVKTRTQNIELVTVRQQALIPDIINKIKLK